MATHGENMQSRPTLIYDGQCEFCSYWVSYWLALTQNGFEAKIYQDAAAAYPDIPLAQFTRQIVFVGADGERAFGADAAFRILALPGGNRFWLWLYRHLPGYAALSERAYAFVSQRRGAAMRISRILWGPRRLPQTHRIATEVFLPLLALVYLAAFISFGTQIHGLIGHNGILPLARYLDAVHNYLGAAAYWQLPTVFWIDAGDRALVWTCALGALLAGLLLVGRWRPPLLILCYGLYLSLFYAGQDFMHFQWDLLLLEVGFLAIFLPTGSARIVWLFRWLLFRFMFLSGCVKLLSGDPTWASLSALDYHFETQPLPTPLAWYAHQLPHRIHQAGTLAALIIELIVPFFIFLPRRPRMLAAAAILLLQVNISLTGNYCFFNLLTMCLCLFLFDDQALSRLLPSRLMRSSFIVPGTKPRCGGRVALYPLAGAIFFLGIADLVVQFDRQTPPRVLAAPLEWVAPLRLVNPYGLFAVMTTSRPEIIIEGSNNGRYWQAYAFKYQPDDLDRRPPWNIPHQPRLDWQMWFAALGSADQNPWFSNLLARLLEGSPAVLGLFRHNPFPDAPPRYLRALLYDYRFATPAERAAGAWWRRKLIGTYFPVVHLNKDAAPAPAAGTHRQ